MFDLLCSDVTSIIYRMVHNDLYRDVRFQFKVVFVLEWDDYSSSFFGVANWRLLDRPDCYEDGDVYKFFDSLNPVSSLPRLYLYSAGDSKTLSV